MEEELEEVVISIDAVTNKLDLGDKNFDLVLVENVFKCEKYFKDILMERLKKSLKELDLFFLQAGQSKEQLS